MGKNLPEQFLSTKLDYEFVCLFQGQDLDVNHDIHSLLLPANHNHICKVGQAGLETAFQVPMLGDSGSSPNAGAVFQFQTTT